MRILLEMEGSDRKNFRVEGEIAMLFRTDDGEFVILRDGDGLLWPIRTDQVISAEARKSARKG
jgi:hypothetical protein